jgi:hypothetical protein
MYNSSIIPSEKISPFSLFRRGVDIPGRNSPFEKAGKLKEGVRLWPRRGTELEKRAAELLYIVMSIMTRLESGGLSGWRIKNLSRSEWLLHRAPINCADR